MNTVDPTYLDLHAVFFQDGGWWRARCLENDVQALAESLPEVVFELDKVLRFFQALEITRPSQTSKEAPKEFRRMFRDATIVITREDTAFPGYLIIEPLEGPWIKLPASKSRSFIKNFQSSWLSAGTKAGWIPRE